MHRQKRYQAYLAHQSIIKKSFSLEVKIVLQIALALRLFFESLGNRISC